ncbi:glycosyltransferase family 2 protein [Paenibacillus sp. B01]|uniref:glycosyltransferase family 2 protein n=1 Tax=Paenibacillus sp. B01 TaxID=2660554 RepID=UPI001E619BC9|nr:glycosyltransferase family 2 protein [Paenibacillus sp. B01]
MTTLSVIMIVCNEENVLSRCLDSVHPHVDEIIVVDTGSDDRTRELASQYPKVKVSSFPWTDHFAEARNFALSQSSSDWNLSLDADEYVIVADWKALYQQLESNPGFIGRVKFIDEFLNGDGEAEHTQNRLARLMPAGTRFTGRIHEQIDSRLVRLNVPLTVRHDGYKAQNKSTRNIPLLEQGLLEEPDNAYWAYQLGREHAGLKQFDAACAYFEQSRKRMNGSEAYAPNAVVSELYALLGLGELNKAEKLVTETHQSAPEFPDYYFACGIFYLDYIMADPAARIHLLPRIEQSYMKAISIGETDRYESVHGTGSFAAWYNLGVFYETTGQMEKAREAYLRSSRYGYKKAAERLAEAGL